MFVDNVGKLGTVPSSRRFKENIIDLKDKSSNIFKLRPVNFNYIADEKKIEQVGLIAEEVEDIFPNLVVRDKNNLVQSVKYQDLPILILNEVQKLRDNVQDQIKEIRRELLSLGNQIKT